MSTNEPTDAEVIADAIMLSGPVRVQVVNVGTTTGFMRRESAEFLGQRVAAALAAAARVRPAGEVAQTPVPPGEQCRACSGPVTRQDLAADDDLPLCPRHWNWWVARFLGSDDAPDVRAHLTEEAARPAGEPMCSICGSDDPSDCERHGLCCDDCHDADLDHITRKDPI